MIDARFQQEPDAALVLSGAGARPDAVELVGARARTAARLSGRGKTWRAVIPLRAARWSGPLLPLPAGDYELRVAGLAEVGEPASLPVTMLGGLRASLDGWAVRIGPPVDPVYDSWEAQAALERRYVNRPAAGLENAVFFESFYGRNVSDNPLAIDAELARQAPGVTRYWSVSDLSIRVPDGATAVVEGSPQWWRARGAARLLVVNDWLRRRYERRPGQHVVQTWHGTPLKRLALHRRGFDPRRMLAVVRESRRWDVLLAQNPYAERILRRAYGFARKPIWVEGYPRNDALHSADAAAARETFGIGPAERVLLYAPTWRDGRARIVEFLDLQALARATDSVVLVRGHSRTLASGTALDGPRVIDVTAFGDAAPLMLCADMLITDYSSIMFDFSVTGKPMLFFIPDLDDYDRRLRGLYFDLVTRAPGPLVRTQEQLTDAVRSFDAARHAARYAAWQARFNARDDGHAAARVVARILDQGFVHR